MSEPSERQRRNLELTRARFDAYNSGDLEYLLTTFHPQLELVSDAGLLNAGTFHGPEGFVQWVTQWNEAWEDFQVEPLRIEPVGEDHVIVDVHQTGHGAGSGIPVEMTVFWAFETIDELTTRAHLCSKREQAVAAVERWRAERG
jgi:ketosteroid isomerase-like protein